LFSVAAFPKATLIPLIARYEQHKFRLIFLALLAIWLVFILGVQVGLMMLANAVALAELLDRSPVLVGRRVLDALIPAAYLFIGLLLIFAINHGIAGLKYAGAWDGFFNQLDSRVFHITVPQFAEWSRVHIPTGIWKLAALAYYNVYGQIGAVMILIALIDGRGPSIRFVGTLLIAYVMALFCFYFMPTMGPFALIKPAAPDWLAGTVFVQKVLPIRASLLWQHAAIPELFTVQIADYYIGFPSMHVAMPMIALWFCRKWKALFVILFLFDIFIVLGVLLLEWHYFMDVIGGMVVAGLAIVANELSSRRSQDRSMSLLALVESYQHRNIHQDIRAFGARGDARK
jgi:hypothetical protein